MRSRGRRARAGAPDRDARARASGHRHAITPQEEGGDLPERDGPASPEPFGPQRGPALSARSSRAKKINGGEDGPRDSASTFKGGANGCPGDSGVSCTVAFELRMPP